MSELLKQALWLTGVGMSMTFASIGVLVLGMYALTALFPEKKGQPPAEAQPVEGPVAQEPVSADRYKAAVAAVAVAVAQTRLRSAAAAVSTPWPGSDEWTPYVRSHHLAQRALYSSRPRR
ncbi:MAG: hypothetical protein DRI37_09430 [Chloroflexi bacterium]|nr:MAG: hypothetical protein DRI37_09430 [Chloroflexota bacterium]